MVRERGDLVWFEAARSPLDEPGQQQRPGDAEERADAEEQREVGCGIREALPARRIALLGDREPDELAVVVEDRRVPGHRLVAVVVDVTDPAASLAYAAVAQVDPLADQSRV